MSAEAGQPSASAHEFPALMASVGRFTVGFVAVGKDRAYSRGSGTLVRFGEVAGILTCAHVLAEVLNQSEIGILSFPVRPGEVQTLKFETELTQHILIGSPPWGELGPDLAYLRLPDHVMANIERIASVVNGLRHRADILERQAKPLNQVELVCGVVDERTQPERVEGGLVVTPFEGIMNMGRLAEIRQVNGMDWYRFEPIPGEGVLLPKSYKGTSGGGLWRIFVKREDSGIYSVVASQLVGVAFWEKPVGEELHIVCHGQSSVYDVLFQQIQSKWHS